MKKLLLVLVFVIFLSSVSAIRINEVEMNPIDGSDGKEWIELYNDEGEDMNISGWEIWEGVSGSSGPKKILSVSKETIIEKDDFYVIELSKSVLNNGGDFVILYDEKGMEVDRTETLEDSEWSAETWQLCDSWEFSEATKGEENTCQEEETPEEKDEKEKESEEEELPEQEEEDEEEEDTKEIIELIKSVKGNPENQSNEEEIKPIVLNPQSIKTETNSGEVSKNYAVYSFIAFSVLLALLFLMKRKKYENEFT